MLILVVLDYNYYSIGVFSLSNVGKLTLYGITSPYWEKSDKFPAEVNKHIESFQSGISKDELDTIMKSWDPAKLYNPFTRNAARAVHSFQYPANEYMKKIPVHAISMHPDIFLKFFYTQLYLFLVDSCSWQTNFYNDIKYLIQRMYLEPNCKALNLSLDNFYFKEYSDFPAIPGFKISDDLTISLVPTPLLQVSTDFYILLRFLFERHIWLLLYAVVLIASIVQLIRYKFTHNGAFLMLSVLLMLILSGILMSMTTAFTNRYPIPTTFIKYFAVFFIPLLFMRGDINKTIEKNSNITNKEQGKK